jgi:hypothetical protein
MTLHWVIQNNFKNETGMVELVELLTRYDIPFTEVKVIPFVGELVPDVNPDCNVICFGSYSMRHPAKEKSWYPGMFDIGDKAGDIFTNKWKVHTLNADNNITTFKDAGNIATQRKWERFFMRPVADTKVFAGNVFELQEYWDWMRKVVVLEQDDGSSLRADTPVVIAEPQKIYAEYRLFVIGDKVVTSSQYKLGHKVIYNKNVPERILKYGQSLVELEPNFMPAYSLDLCETQYGIKIVEVNTINSSGFYDADVSKIIIAFQEIYG